ncbi:hypothetical protein MNBD_GAMMA24-927 [hydrothermal vent metagenome]|uniref:Sulfotransferase n=1 Tax=hydrothermal vent metagenome TaxID=652676 RepID=A0A3B1B5Q0_9ZZZZ
MGNFEQPFLVIGGSGRSGTTWVLDAVAQANGLRTIFEPLHPFAIPEMRPYAYRYIPTDCDSPGLQVLMEGFADGSFHSIWSDYRVRTDRLRPRFETFCSRDKLSRFYRRWKKLYKNYHTYNETLGHPRVITKFIRANQMLGWIRKHFDARIVLLVRHPGAVVESQLRLGGDDWNPYEMLDHYRNDEALLSTYGTAYRRLLGQDLTPAQALTTVWCIQNQMPLREAEHNDVVVVYYERLLENPAQEWERIIRGLGLPHAPDAVLLKRPSQQASMQSSRGGFDPQSYRRWMDRIPTSALEDVNRILQEFEMTVYDAHDPLPKGDLIAAPCDRPRSESE